MGEGGRREGDVPLTLGGDGGLPWFCLPTRPLLEWGWRSRRRESSVHCMAVEPITPTPSSAAKRDWLSHQRSSRRIGTRNGGILFDKEPAPIYFFIIISWTHGVNELYWLLFLLVWSSPWQERAPGRKAYIACSLHHCLDYCPPWRDSRVQRLHTGRGVSCNPSLPHIVVGQEAEERQEAGSWWRNSPFRQGRQGGKPRTETKQCDICDHIAAPARKQQWTVDRAQRTLSILGQELVPPTVRMGLPASSPD